MKPIYEYLLSKSSTPNDLDIDKYNDKDIEDILQEIVETTDEDPQIWDDTMRWDAKDNFEYWEDSWGTYVDDIVDILDYEIRNYAVAGWYTETSFEDTEKVIPDVLFQIMREGDHSVPWKKRSQQLDVWELMNKNRKPPVTFKVLKFMKMNNKDGTDFCEYWYIIALE